MLGTLARLPPQGVRREGMTSNQHGPYVRGDTRVTMAVTKVTINFGFANLFEIFLKIF
jgi:hypothetical protein